MIKFITTILLFISFNSNAQVILGRVTGSGSLGGSGIDFAGKAAVFMGNSITYGIAASDNAHRWTTLFCTAKGATEDNKGVSGTTIQDNGNCAGAISAFDYTTIPTYTEGTHAALFFAYGINDVGLNKAAYTAAGFRSRYQTILTYAISTKGWPPERIIMLTVYHPYAWTVYTTISGCGISVAATDTRGEEYNAEITDLAADNGCLLTDLWTAMLGLNSSYYAMDELHLVDAGHAFVANYLISVL